MKLAAIAAAVLISVLLLTSAVMQPWNDRDTVSLTAERTTGTMNDSIAINYTLASSQYSDPVNIVLTPVETYRSDPIFIFSEKEAFSIEDYARVLGLYDHLSAEMETSDVHRSVELVDRAQLEDVLNGGPAILIIVNSTQDWSGQSSAMLTWIDNGGTIVGLGKGALPFVGSNISENDPYQITYDPLSYDGGQGVTPSATAAALDFKYVSPTFGMRVSDVQTYGSAIGYLYQRETELTSAAIVHRGNGTIILFSDVMSQPFTASMEDVMANDLMRIVQSGLPWQSGPMTFLSLMGGANPIKGVIPMSVSNSTFLVCYLFSLDDDQHINRVLVI